MTGSLRSWLIRGGVVVACDDRSMVTQADVAVRGDTIVAIGARAADALEGSARVIDARGSAVIPGFVQAHVHLCQTLFRGLADELALLDWLKTRIWPLEAAHDERSMRTSAELGLAEMIRAGTTSILDMGSVHEQEAVFDACARSGIRATSGKAMMDAGSALPSRLRERTVASLRASERLARTWSGAANGRIGYAYAPRFILSCTERLVRETVELASATNSIVHTHAAEHAAERAAVRDAHGDHDVAVLARWGVRGDRAVLAHGVQLTSREIATIARHRTRFVHCPSANLKLGSGIAPLAAMRKAGIVVGLGADGAPCNNGLDPWTEMRQAALLASVTAGPGSLPALEALKLATIHGARTLGIDKITGSLEVGKRADLVVVRLDGPELAPALDPVSALVYGGGRRDVRVVMVDGEPLVKDGELARADVGDVVADARTQAKRLLARARL